MLMDLRYMSTWEFLLVISGTEPWPPSFSSDGNISDDDSGKFIHSSKSKWVENIDKPEPEIESKTRYSIWYRFMYRELQWNTWGTSQSFVISI